MPRYDFDMFTIGAGSGGVASSRRAGAYGARVAICEELRVGGTCVLRGCVPKKLLVYGAQFADAFADAEGFGWTVPTADFDWPKLIAAKDKEIGRLSQIYINMLNNAKVKIIDGRGVVVDPHTVEVNGKNKGTLPGKATADAIVSTWIGPKPAMGDDFKNAILGK